MDILTYLLAKQTAGTSYDDSDIKDSIEKLQLALDIINGTSEGSIKKAVADGIALVIANAPESLDTLKEQSDWILEHSESAADMNSRILENSESINSLKSSVENLASQISTLTNQLAAYNTNFNNLKASLGTAAYKDVSTGWEGVAYIRGDGVMEIGKYIDFHLSSDDTSDYAQRILAAEDGVHSQPGSFL